MRLRLPFALGLVLGLLPLGCGEDTQVTTCCAPILPTPTPTPPLVVGSHTGPTEITLLEADPAPGATLSGCGTDASACDGRIRMRFRLHNLTGGPALYAVGFLHGPNKVSCWQGRTAPFRLEAGAPLEILVVFDQRDPAVCRTPFDVANMKLVVEGTVEVASLQEWAVRYSVQP